MFSGIIEEVAQLESITKRSDYYELKVRSKKITADLALGDSVAIDGVCLTLKAKDRDRLTFDLIAETYSNTKFKYPKRGRLNLERALRLGDRISGHILTGHIDTVISVVKIERRTKGLKIYLKLPLKYKHLIVDKGSVALDGVSLTVQDLKPDSFSVAIIPYTKEWTNLGDLRVGSKVNIEFDLFGKYVDRRLKIGA
ncbi:MAG: riboflavin synthase [Candidatus Kaelpia aquatica]|nr:riboflavin synthase [Candidatus Kaelpia aquatica]